DEIQLEIAVAVHVEKRSAAAHDLGQVELVAVARAVSETDGALLGRPLEPRAALSCDRHRSLRAKVHGCKRNDRRDGGFQDCAREGLRYICSHRRRLRRCSAACFTSGESGLSCDACCSAAAARSHSPRAMVAFATPTHAWTLVGSRRVARPKLSSAL